VNVLSSTGSLGLSSIKCY